METILIVDDERNIRGSLSDAFRLEGYRAVTASDGNEALDVLRREDVDLVMLDLQMPDMDGLATLREIRAAEFAVPVVILTAHGSIDTAVEAIRLGAFDFLEKPPHADRVLLTARNALRQATLARENEELRSDALGEYDMIGKAAPMRDLYRDIERVAPTNARVLILGENGSGKELIARALHDHSPRAARPFVRVNCAAIPDELFESELFGHERGAFTGATSRRRGKFQRAHRGTLFLDEVGEIPPGLQAKLLRALESGEIEPVGSEREIRVDVRVVAATNRDLERAVSEGSFRRDLYYRLQVVTLQAPPLRDRREDIPELVRHFLVQASRVHGLPRKEVAPQAMRRLETYDYPGNVRELRNLVERLVILTPSETIDVKALERAMPSPVADPSTEVTLAAGETLKETMTRLEASIVRRTLDAVEWKMTAAARRLGLERSHLYKKLRALGIERER